MDHSSEQRSDLRQTPDFEARKRAYFSQLATKVLPALRLHKKEGLFVRTEEGQRDWGNVSEHCLVEAARVGVLADLLNLPVELKEDMVLAAALHDFYKRVEVTKLRGEATWETYSEAQKEAKAILKLKEISPRIISLATSVGHEEIPKAKELVSKSQLADEEIAWLVTHYVDDYTIDAAWVSQTEDGTDGQLVNDLNRRMSKLRHHAEAGEKYQGVNLSGVDHFGELTYDAQERTGEMVESRLAQLVSAVSGTTIEPKLLPEIIDARLAELISIS